MFLTSEQLLFYENTLLNVTERKLVKIFALVCAHLRPFCTLSATECKVAVMMLGAIARATEPFLGANKRN